MNMTYNFRAAPSFSSSPSSFSGVVAATVVAAAVVAAAVVGAAVVAAAVVGAAVVGAGVVVGLAAIATGAVAMPGIIAFAPPFTAGIVAMPVAGIPDASGTWLAWTACSARLAGAIDRCWAGSVLLTWDGKRSRMK